MSTPLHGGYAYVFSRFIQRRGQSIVDFLFSSSSPTIGAHFSHKSNPWHRTILFLFLGPFLENRSVFGPEEGENSVAMAMGMAGAAGGQGKVEEGASGLGPGLGLEAVTTRRIVKARGYGGLAPGEALARALGVAIGLGCISPRRLVVSHSTAQHVCTCMCV